MTYKEVKGIISKVISIVESLNNLSNEELSKLVNKQSNDREYLIGEIIKSRLTTNEYAIYLKYCEFYKTNKALEYQDLVLSLNEKINSVTSLFNERQSLLSEKHHKEQERTEIKRSIELLPWIRLDIAYDHLKKSHSTFVSSVTKSILKESALSDEIAKLESSSIVRRLTSKKELEELNNKKNKLKNKSSDKERDAVISDLEAYKEALIYVLKETLKNNKIFNAIISSIRLDNTPLPINKEEQKDLIIDLFITYAETEFHKNDESFTSCMEEGVYPPVAKLQVPTKEEYKTYLTNFILRSITLEISRLEVKSGRILSSIRSSLDNQRKDLNNIQDNLQGIIPSSNLINEEEKNIFQLIYKESKK